MAELTLPPCTGGGAPPQLPHTRLITLVGAPGAGKSRFMNALVESCGDSACLLSAVGARFPEVTSDPDAGSIDSLYRDAAAQRPYMRTDAVSQLDKLMYMIMVDEFDSLLALKMAHAARRQGKPVVHPGPTPLDRLAEIWERLFPGNRIVPSEGSLMFATSSGDDLIPISRLSEGETAVLYYVAAALYAPSGAVMFIESPSLFLHPSIVSPLWNAVEELRPDCTFVYDAVDADFVASRTQNVCVWIKSYDAELHAWDYEIVSSTSLSDQIFVDLMGTRKPVLFIEGDSQHSIDAKLYPLVFPDYTVSPLGSCNKVIETVRSFNDRKAMHHLDSHGIVDRDRRTDEEVAYLRRKNIFVPEVAEVENIFLMEEVISTMAEIRGRNPQSVVARVRKEVFKMFHEEYKAQALQHVRHRVKREVETKIDARFTCITALETHLSTLVNRLRPRDTYNQLISEFYALLEREDYAGVLRVFNHKPMLANCGVAQLLGYPTKDHYVEGVISALRRSTPASRRLRAAVKFCFGLTLEEEYIVPIPPPQKKKKPQRTEPAPEEQKTKNTSKGRRDGGEDYNPSRHKKRSRAKQKRMAKRRARGRSRDLF